MALCGAKRRDGKPCTQKSMANGRCRMHGGKSTGPKSDTRGHTNALTHGIYSDAIDPTEKALWERIEIGGIDDEIKIAKLQLRRALMADKPDAAEKLLGRIAQMEKTRKEIDETSGPDTPFDELNILEYDD